MKDSGLPPTKRVSCQGPLTAQRPLHCVLCAALCLFSRNNLADKLPITPDAVVSPTGTYKLER